MVFINQIRQAAKRIPSIKFRSGGKHLQTDAAAAGSSSSTVCFGDPYHFLSIDLSDVQLSSIISILVIS
jgi:hypothetical protein